MIVINFIYIICMIVNKHYSTASGMIRNLFSENDQIPNFNHHYTEDSKSEIPFERRSSLWQASENRDSNEDVNQFEGRTSTFRSFE